ncbi:MAG: hypothetical protein NT067_05345 [Candidatus Diapherotrites archaeon]|nr:hypothetical protein [Candidatus Diapherotrites archaeon]
MKDTEFLSYLSKSPFREALGFLAKEEGLNRFQLMGRLSDSKSCTGMAELKTALGELECRGFIASVNECYHFQKEWFKDFVLFLEEFEESREELDLCEQMLGQGILNAVYRKNDRRDF